jgi:hypothetical protein
MQKNDWWTKITSYKTSHIKNSDVRRFNRRFSRIRIDIEHAFEMLKERKKSLIKLGLRIHDLKNYIFAIRWIIACVITSRNKSIRIDFDSSFVTPISTRQEINSVSIRFDSISNLIDFDSKAKWTLTSLRNDHVLFINSWFCDY